MRQMRDLLTRNSDLLLAVTLTVVAVYVDCDVFPQVRFDRERIEIWTAPQQIQVSGLYHYANPSRLPAFLSLGLPFPVDGDHPRPSIFAIAEATTDGRVLAQIAPIVRHGNVSFRIFLKPRADKWVRVDYIQGANVPRGRYILTSTRQWHRPLERGEYILHLALGTELVADNYPLAPTGATNTYSFSETDFYPSEDWEFAWRKTAAGSSAGASDEAATESSVDFLDGDTWSHTGVGQ
jgi:hypothetical protein